MKKLILLTIILFTCAIRLFAQSDTDSTIVWRTGRKLSWSDFQGKLDTSTKYGAVSSCGFKYQLIGDSLMAYAYFNKKKSRVRVKDFFGLVHENGHFDIVEFFVRKLKQEFEQQRLTGAKMTEQITDSLAAQMLRRLEDYQELYDKATHYHINTKQQQYWMEIIRNELYALRKYAGE